MRDRITNYIPYIRNFVKNSDAEVAEFAKNLLEQTDQLLNEELPVEQYRNGPVLTVLESMTDQQKLDRNSLNYLRSRIAEFYHD